MPDRWRERLSLWLSILTLAGFAATGIAWATGKVGVVVTGPPERIDSLVAVVQTRAAAGAETHERMDSTNAAQDRRLVAVEGKSDMILALLCVNTKPRDLALTRIPCDQYVGRWRAPGATP